MVDHADLARVEELRQQIAHHNDRYYGDDAPEISDSDYDQLVRELRALETKYPELLSPDSPTSVVGSAKNSSFSPVVHARPMQSLDNAFDDEDLRNWVERLAKAVPDEVLTFTCEPKVDGLAMSLTYRNGVLRGLAEFCVGIGLAVLFRHADAIARLPASAHSSMQAVALFWLGWATYRTGWSHTHKDIFTVLPIMAMVFVLAFDKGFLAEMLKTRLPQLLGAWSYAIYLGQTVWLQGLRVIEQQFYPDPDAHVLGVRFSTLIWWLEPTVLVLVCVLWGGLLAAYVEHPMTTWFRKRTGGTHAA